MWTYGSSLAMLLRKEDEDCPKSPQATKLLRVGILDDAKN